MIPRWWAKGYNDLCSSFSDLNSSDSHVGSSLCNAHFRNPRCIFQEAVLLQIILPFGLRRLKGLRPSGPQQLGPGARARRLALALAGLALAAV